MAQKTTKQKARQQAHAQQAASRPNWIFRGAIAAVVIAGAGWLLLGGRGGPGSPPTPEELMAAYEAAEADPSVGVVLGPESAPITIEEFYDPSCPYCAQFAGFAGKLIRQNYVETPDARVRWISYEFLVGFPHSLTAAHAARCAAEQDLFWPAHDLILARQGSWDRLPSADRANAVIAEIAEEAGVDSGPWGECMSDRRHLGAIASSQKLAEERGVSATPSVYVDGELVNLGSGDPYPLIADVLQRKLDSTPLVGSQ